jgi:hypothetical protein
MKPVFYETLNQIKIISCRQNCPENKIASEMSLYFSLFSKVIVFIIAEMYQPKNNRGLFTSHFTALFEQHVACQPRRLCLLLRHCAFWYGHSFLCFLPVGHPETVLFHGVADNANGMIPESNLPQLLLVDA